MATVIMAQRSKTHNNNHSNNNNNNVSSVSAYSSSVSQRQQPLQQQEQLKPMFHDFLGMKTTNDSPVLLASKAPAGDASVAEASPSASASAGASSGGGGGARGPMSTTSDLGSVERQVVSHLEGVPYYGPRSDISGPEVSNKLVGSKRSNSDSAFMGSSRDAIPQTGHESLESLQFLRILRNGPFGDRPKRSHDDEVLLSAQAIRPTSSLVLHPPIGNRIDPNASKWERAMAMNAGQAIHYPPRSGQFVPFIHQAPPNRFRDANAGPSIISQSAADEGSRTGMKGPGILSSVNATGGVTEKTSSGLLPSSSKPKSGTNNEPESSTPPGQQGLASASRQMTIFYGGQAHVFDDVHPNKADVIMALAGSNGGSWSTTFSPKSTAKPSGESQMPSGEYEAGMAGNSNTGYSAFPPGFHGRLSVTGSTSHGIGCSGRVSAPTGGYQGGVIIGKDTRNPVQAGESHAEEKKEV